MPRSHNRHDRLQKEAAIIWKEHERLVWNRARQWSLSVGQSPEDLVSAAKEAFFREWFSHYDPTRARWTTYIYRVASNFFNRMRHKRMNTEPIEDYPHFESGPDLTSSERFLRKFERCSPITLNVLAFILEYNDCAFEPGVHARRRFGMVRELLLSVEYNEEELLQAFREIRRVLRHGH